MAATSMLSLHAFGQTAPRLDVNLDGVIDFRDFNAVVGEGNFSHLNAIITNWGVRTIIPGQGGPPLPPPPGGEASGKKPIARWADPPFQTASGAFRVRVVAADASGILAVSFSANESSSVFVTEPVWSPTSGGYEYVALIEAADLGVDERVEINAIVYPNSGSPRILAGDVNASTVASGEHSLVVFGPSSEPVACYVDRNGNDTTGDGSAAHPFKTLDRAMRVLPTLGENAALTIYLRAGAHPFGGPRVAAPNDRWVTITSAPGVNPASVRLVAGESTRLGAPHVRLKNLTLDQREGWTVTSYSTVDDALWLDTVRCLGPGRFAYAGTIQSTPVFANNVSAFYVTGSSAEDYVNGFRGATIVSNSTIQRLGSDAYSNSRLVLNCSVNDIDNGSSSFHPDVYQFSGTGSRDNTFIRGLTATNAHCQGMFADDLAEITNTYLGNISIERSLPDPNSPPWSQWIIHNTTHLVIEGMNAPDSTWAWRANSMRHIRISGFHAFRQIGTWDPAWFVD